MIEDVMILHEAPVSEALAFGSWQLPAKAASALELAF